MSRSSRLSVDDDDGDQAECDDSECPERPATEAQIVAYFEAIGTIDILVHIH